MISCKIFPPDTRTDTGVHAIHNSGHCDLLPGEASKMYPAPRAMTHSLNTWLENRHSCFCIPNRLFPMQYAFVQLYVLCFHTLFNTKLVTSWDTKVMLQKI